MPHNSNRLALGTSIAGNLSLAGLFLCALLAPLAHVNFIIQTGVWIFLVEFFSIFVSSAGGNLRSNKIFGIITSVAGLSAISVFVLAFGRLFLGNIYLPLVFLGSTVAKMLGRRATPHRPFFAYSILLLLGSVSVVFIVLGPELLVNLFPFPEEFNQHLPADWATRNTSGEISGEFIDRPQTMLVWGIVYFFSLAVVEIVLFFKELQEKTKMGGETSPKGSHKTSQTRQAKSS